MYKSEFEIVPYPKLRHINIFLNKIIYRNLHFHNEIELLYILEGEAIVRSGGDNFAIKSGSILLFNSNEAHEIDASISDKGITAIILQISRNFLRDYFPVIKTSIFKEINVSSSLDDKELEELRYLIRQSSIEYISADTLYELECISSITRIINTLMLRIPNVQFSEQEYLAKKKNIKRMSRIFSYIDNNYEYPIRLQDVAEQESITPTHLSHIFSDNLGITFQEYLNNKRFEHAVRLISNASMTLYEIAIASGFSDPKYMAKMFLKRFHCSPKEFRRTLLNNSSLSMDTPSRTILEFHYNDKDSLEIISKY